jgi:hypothetical protein
VPFGKSYFTSTLKLQKDWCELTLTISTLPRNLLISSFESTSRSGGLLGGEFVASRAGEAYDARIRQSKSEFREEQVMGNRDKRGREKKKPKKKPKRKQIKTLSRPAKPATEYKPAAPTSQTDEGTGE